MNEDPVNRWLGNNARHLYGRRKLSPYAYQHGDDTSFIYVVSPSNKNGTISTARCTSCNRFVKNKSIDKEFHRQKLCTTSK